MCGAPRLGHDQAGSSEPDSLAQDILARLDNLGISCLCDQYACGESQEFIPIPRAPGQLVTREDVERLHVMIEYCIDCGMSKLETCKALSKIGVNEKVTDITWTRLELENPDYFERYNSYLKKCEDLAQQEKETAANNAMISRCSSSCSLSTQQTAFDNNAAGFWYSCC